MQQKKGKTADNRKRNFTMLMYDDSAPGWKDRLNDLHVPYFYAYHDKDISEKTGKPEKPHYHLMIMFEGKKTPEQVQAIADKLGASNGVYKPLESVRGMARYLMHLDDPEKYQYGRDRVVVSGADYDAIINLPSDKYKMIGEMIEWCQKEDIISYAELLEYSQVHRSEWFKCLCDNGTMVMREYLKSREWTKAKNKQYDEYVKKRFSQPTVKNDSQWHSDVIDEEEINMPKKEI